MLCVELVNYANESAKLTSWSKAVRSLTADSPAVPNSWDIMSWRLFAESLPGQNSSRRWRRTFSFKCRLQTTVDAPGNSRSNARPSQSCIVVWANCYRCEITIDHFRRYGMEKCSVAGCRQTTMYVYRTQIYGLFTWATQLVSRNECTPLILQNI